MIRRNFKLILCAFLLSSITIISWAPVSSTKITGENTKAPIAKSLFEEYVSTVYQTAKLQQAGLDLTVFQKAITGYINLKLANKLPQNSSVITVVDFTKPSREKRMWIVDVLTKQLLLNTWVAHGQGSGDDMATQFSDNNESHQSSLGFYLTDDVYNGKHGRSLRLDGLDAGFNASARARAIVVHAADYVSESSIEKLGRLGRSFGCPAVSPQVRDEVINDIKGKTVLFINGNNSNYTSKYLDESNLDSFTPDSTSEYQAANSK